MRETQKYGENAERNTRNCREEIVQKNTKDKKTAKNISRKRRKKEKNRARKLRKKDEKTWRKMRKKDQNNQSENAIENKKCRKNDE